MAFATSEIFVLFVCSAKIHAQGGMQELILQKNHHLFGRDKLPVCPAASGACRLGCLPLDHPIPLDTEPSDGANAARQSGPLGKNKVRRCYWEALQHRTWPGGQFRPNSI